MPRIRNVALVGMVTVFLGICGSGLAQPVTDIDGLFESPFVFQNDFGTVLTITNNFPTTAIIDERNFTNSGIGFQANRHDLLFSNDGGVTPRLFDTFESFDVSADVTLETGFVAPRKEAGFRVNNGGFDGLFIINSDANEIVAFGGALPFYSFNANFGISYAAGDTINMRMIYNAPDLLDPANNPGTIEYRVHPAGDPMGPYTSGPIVFTNLEFGLIPNSEIGVYAQATGSLDDPNDFITVTYNNFDVEGPSTPTGDFNNDGFWNCTDINALSTAIAGGSTDLAFDMNGDGSVTLADITAMGTGWLAVGGANNPVQTSGNAFLNGDANLGGGVDGSDFSMWNANKFATNSNWCDGDFNASGGVDGSDFSVWNGNKFMSSDQTHAVPEPASILWLSVIPLWNLVRRRP